MAALRFDATRGIEFATFASIYIRGYILRQYRDFETGPIKPTKVGIAAEMKIPQYLYIDGMINDNGDCFGYEYIDSCVDNEEELIAKILLKQMLNLVTVKERKVIELTLEGKTQTEIGQILGCTQTYISRLKRKAQKKLKERKEIGEKYAIH